MDITTLPNDVFLIIAEHLTPRDLVASRSVSKCFYAAFTETDLNRRLLLKHYPRSRELRCVHQCTSHDWAQDFSRVAGRYRRLQTGVPSRAEKLALTKSLVLPAWSRHFAVSPWERHLQFEGRIAPFHYPDPLWAYDEGVLIYPSAESQSYVLYNLNAGTKSYLDIESEKKIVRRIRMNESVLLFEWCEPESYHQINENESVYRHFATAYDVKESRNGQMSVVFRNEWKIHFLGMPLNSSDRFFSTHSSDHYALYVWQPNRSAWGEDEPMESLAIWDISSPSSYRPSEDPAGKGKPDDGSEGPRVVRRFSFVDLDFYKIRQRSTPVLHRLGLDENHVYVIEEDHRWLVGNQASHTLPRLHQVKTTGIPFHTGPRWQDECGADGDINMSYCERRSETRGPGKAPCWRHEEFPYLTISEAVDSAAGVVFSARHWFMLEKLSINVEPKVMAGSEDGISLIDHLWQQLLNKGRICGDERWLIGENNKQEVVVMHFDDRKRSE
ncbi:F-box domain-containing protein [Diplocarpon rosae]|nr:F-box domain-containing protein [Diplocarpon rosae]